MASNQGGNQGTQRGQGSRGGRGFASMDQDRQREIASLGGRAAHQRGTAHEFTSEEAREAGRKGGEAVSQDRRHMAAIGSKGGQSRGAKNRSRAQAANAQPANVRPADGAGAAAPSGMAPGTPAANDRSLASESTRDFDALDRDEPGTTPGPRLNS
jgi:uncharacterized protein